MVASVAVCARDYGDLVPFLHFAGHFSLGGDVPNSSLVIF